MVLVNCLVILKVIQTPLICLNAKAYIYINSLKLLHIHIDIVKEIPLKYHKNSYILWVRKRSTNRKETDIDVV